jgi:uridylate kinase
MYKRVLLKLSGEQLSGKFEFGIDPEIGAYLAEEVKKASAATGCKIVLVVGGGNMVRGAKIAGHGIKRVTADQMGMLSGLINSMALTDIFESRGVETRCMSNIYATQLAESFSYRLAEKHLERDRVIIVAGGLGRPYFTHDTAAVSLALELDCQIVLKATKVDGIYDKDPNKHKDAKRLESVTFERAVSDDAIMVMDKAALGLAMENKQPVAVFDVFTPDNLRKLISGEPVGTIIDS